MSSMDIEDFEEMDIDELQEYFEDNNLSEPRGRPTRSKYLAELKKHNTKRKRSSADDDENVVPAFNTMRKNDLLVYLQGRGVDVPSGKVTKADLLELAQETAASATKKTSPAKRARKASRKASTRKKSTKKSTRKAPASSRKAPASTTRATTRASSRRASTTRASARKTSGRKAKNNVGTRRNFLATEELDDADDRQTVDEEVSWRTPRRSARIRSGRIRNSPRYLEVQRLRDEQEDDEEENKAEVDMAAGGNRGMMLLIVLLLMAFVCSLVFVPECRSQLNALALNVGPTLKQWNSCIMTYLGKVFTPIAAGTGGGNA